MSKNAIKVRFKAAFFCVGLALNLTVELQAQSPADIAWRDGDLPEVERIYSTRLAADSTDQEALFRVGLALAWTDRYGESLELFDRLVTIAPGNTGARIARARILAWQGRFTTSSLAIDSILLDQPDNLEALQLKGQVSAWAGRTAEAMYAYSRLLEHADQDSILKHVALVGLANANEANGDLPAAERFWILALGTGIEHNSARGGLFRTLRLQGRSPEVLAIADSLPPNEVDEAITTEIRESQRTLTTRGGFGLTNENDSDGNNMTTVQIRGRFHPTRVMSLGFNAYARSTDFDASVNGRSAQGAVFSASVYLSPGWYLSGGLGGSVSNATAGTTFFNGFVSTSSPRKHKVTGALTFSHAALDATTALIERRVSIRELSFSGNARPTPDWTVTAKLSKSWLSGTQDNTRTLLDAAGTYRISTEFGVGTHVRAFGFQFDLNDGYFDPDLYYIIELPATWTRRFDSWSLTGELAPGFQQVGTDGGLNLAFRGQTRAAYTIAPGRSLALQVTYSRSSASAFATGATDYKYLAVGITGEWSP